MPIRVAAGHRQEVDVAAVPADRFPARKSVGAFAERAHADVLRGSEQPVAHEDIDVTIASVVVTGNDVVVR